MPGVLFNDDGAGVAVSGDSDVDAFDNGVGGWVAVAVAGLTPLAAALMSSNALTGFGVAAAGFARTTNLSMAWWRGDSCSFGLYNCACKTALQMSALKFDFGCAHLFCRGESARSGLLFVLADSEASTTGKASSRAPRQEHIARKVGEHNRTVGPRCAPPRSHLLEKAARPRCHQYHHRSPPTQPSRH